MARNPDVVVLGEDVGKFGGVFRATAGLYEQFGPNRVIDTPLAEGGIVGAAIGMSLYGMRPVPEIQFSDFIFPAFDQITSELAKMRYRGTLRYMLPWMHAELDDIDAVFGGDPWPYGVEPNRPTLEALVRYLAEQGVIAKAPRVDDLFVPVRVAH